MPRSIATSRVTATNRTAVRNAINASLNFNGSTSTVSLAGLTTLTAPITITAWINRSVKTASHAIVAFNATNTMLFRCNTGSNAIGFWPDSGGSTVAWTEAQISAAGGAIGRWMHVAVTYNGSAAVLYVNGTLVSSQALSGAIASSGNVVIGSRQSVVDPFKGNISQVKIFSRILTAQEIIDTKNGDGPLDSRVLDMPFDEGAGTASNDKSGNGYTGTITAGTWVGRGEFDLPSRARKTIGRNLVYNGNFEYAPPFTAATNTGSRWIDGTAGGSTTGDVLGWAVAARAGTAQVSFATDQVDTGSFSLKLSTLATASGITCATVTTVTSADMVKYAYVVVPSTSYTLTYRMKTSVTSGSATSGAYASFAERDASGAQVAETTGTKVVTTTGWTTYTVTAIAGSTSRFATIKLYNRGDDGAATLMMDAWFDNVEFRPTVLVGRSAAS